MEPRVLPKRFSLGSELEQYQYMIDSSARRLDALRTLGMTNSATVQQEVRELESKLIRLFSRQLAFVNSIDEEGLDTEIELRKYPKFGQWLEVVGLQASTIQALMQQDLDLRTLKSMEESVVGEIVRQTGGDSEDRRCLVTAVEKLRWYSERLERGDATTGKDNLYWNSRRNPDELLSAASQPVHCQCTTEASPPCSPAGNPNSPSISGGTHQHSPSPIQSNRARSPTPTCSASISTTPVSSTPPSTPGSTRYFLIAPMIRRAQSQDDHFMNSTATAVSKSGSASNLLARHERTSLERRRNRSCDALLESSVKTTVETVADGSTAVKSNSGQSKSRMKSFAKRLPHLKKTDRQSSVKSMQEEDLLALPLSPGVVGMRHSIAHRFRSKIFLGSQECDYCHKLMVRGKKCSECKFKCHKKCVPLVPSSCGLPSGYEKFFKMQILQNEPHSGTHYGRKVSPQLSKFSPQLSHHSPLAHSERMKMRTVSSISSPPTASRDYEVAKVHLPASLSHSDLLDRIQVSPQPTRRTFQTSGSSSTPPSPISPVTFCSSSPNSPLASAGMPRRMADKQSLQFDFPVSDVPATTDDLLLDKFRIPRLFVQRASLVPPVSGRSLSVDQLDGCRTTEERKQTDSSAETKEMDQALTECNSQQQEEEEDDTFEESHDGFMTEFGDSYGSEVSVESGFDVFRRSGSRHHRGSLLSEWEIPYSELQLRRLIAKGKMGEVYHGYWHGDVCVKMLHLASPTNEQLAQFKFEVTILKKTRHENVALFMGACLTPPHLAIVTSFIHGETLYRLIHEKEEHFTAHNALMVAMETVRGMGYLHARHIVHKDLRSKNVFLEKGRVVITDFGLSPVSGTEKARSRPGYLRIPRGHLCYLAPEIVMLLKSTPKGLNSFWRSRDSDVYAFGILWYELLAGKWPYSRQRAERTIYQIGASLKPSLSSLSVTQTTKNLFAKCWAKDPKKRPSFSELYVLMDKLPKKQLQRSPSYPTKLSRTNTDISF